MEEIFLEVVLGKALSGKIESFADFNEDTVKKIKVEIKTEDGKVLKFETDFFQLRISDYE